MTGAMRSGPYDGVSCMSSIQAGCCLAFEAFQASTVPGLSVTLMFWNPCTSLWFMKRLVRHLGCLFFP
jgi:hypothetical protein